MAISNSSSIWPSFFPSFLCKTFTMEWHLVQKKERNRSVANDIQTEEEIHQLLATFKTTFCTIEEFHDHRPCIRYHDNTNDRRRNPYDQHYSVEECLNTLDRMYHPEIFRTQPVLCKRMPCCPFGRNCAHAHSSSEMRDHQSVAREYESLPVFARPLRALASFVPAQSAIRDYNAECRALWTQLSVVTPQTRFVPLQENEWFLTQQSEALFHEMKQIAFEEGIVSRECIAGKQGLIVKGVNVNDIHICILSILAPPSQHFHIGRYSFGERVLERLKNYSDWANTLMDTNDIHIQFTGSNDIQVTAVHSQNGNAKANVKRVHKTIQFWIDREGYSTFKECLCCGEDRNEDQGVACTNGHFFCSAGEEDDCCFAAAVSSQINEIRSREEGLVCPSCQEPYGIQKIASHLPESVWASVQKALIDREVERQTEILENEFEDRLNEKVQEVFEKYGNADELLIVEAKREAHAIRNTILNLACPHCNIACADFSGCMALEGQSCRKHFCGYCHFAAATGSGAHDHVRQCLMNESENGSYYATSEEIVKAQKKYRTRELKKYLRRFKKDKQNAIVIELQRDLKDHEIKGEALFEVGNLQG